MAIWDALVEGGVKSVILAGVGVLVVLCVCCVCCCKICRRKNGGLEDEDILVRESFNSGLLGNGSWQTNSHIGQLVSMIYPNHGSLQRLGMLDFNMLSADDAAGPFAAGGGGVLYKGTFLNKRVAIKALHSQMFEASDLEEISHEAALLVRVAHENIVKLYGVAHHQG
jgi:serine/threonine protein kinase